MAGVVMEMGQDVSRQAHEMFTKIMGEKTVAEPLLSQGFQPDPRRSFSL